MNTKQELAPHDTPLAWPELRVLELAPEEKILASDRFLRLGLGERTCFAVAAVRSAMLATDDKAAGQLFTCNC